MKKPELKWFVMYIEPNSKLVKKYNIFNDDFRDNLLKEVKKGKITSYDTLWEYVDRWAHYYYWSKTECEMLVGDLFSKSTAEMYKIDMYYQIEINMANILGYLITTLKIDFDKK